MKIDTSTLPITRYDDGEEVYDSTARAARTVAEHAEPAAAAETRGAALKQAANDTTAEGEATPAPDNATSRALAEVTTNIAEFDKVEEGLRALEKKHGGVIFAAMDTPKGFKAAKEALSEVRAPRFAVQHAVDNAKGPLNALKGAIAARGANIIERIKVIETPIEAQVTAETKRRADEKQRLEKEAADRKKAIDDAIAEIRSRVDVCINQSAAFIAETIVWLDDTDVTEEDFGDRTEEANEALRTTRERLVGMRAVAEAAETAAANAKAQAEQLAAQKAELDRRQTELDRREAIDTRIKALRELPATHVTADVSELRELLDKLAALTEEDFGERLSEAAAIAEAITPALRTLLATAEAALKAENARILDALHADVPSSPPQMAQGHALELAAREEYEAAAPAPASVEAPAPAPAVVAVVASGIAIPALATAPVHSYGGGGSLRAPAQPTRPTDEALIEVLSLHYRVHESKVIEWLLEMDLIGASNRLVDAMDRGDVPF